MNHKSIMWLYSGFLCFFVVLMGYELYLGSVLAIMETETKVFKSLYVFTTVFTLYNCYTITKALIKHHNKDAQTKMEG